MITAPVVLLAAMTLAVAGMMLVIGGVLSAGLFLPGVVLIVLSLVAFATAGVLAMLRPAAEPAQARPRVR